MRAKIKALPWARSLFNDRISDVIALTAGLGAGKTHTMDQWHLLMCLLNRKSPRSVIMYPTYSEIKGVGFSRMVETLMDSGFKENLDFECFTSQTDPHIDLKFLGNRIDYVSAHNPKRIRAFEYSHGSADEVGDIEEDAYRNLRGRIRCRRAVKRQSLWTGAPQGLGWFSDEFDSDTQDGWENFNGPTDRVKRKYNDILKRDVVFRRVRVRTDDNPFLPDDYLSTLMETYGHNKNLIRSYRYGIFCPLYEGSAYDSFDEERHVSDEVTADKMRPLYLTFDFNAYPLVWTAVQIVPIEVDGVRQKRYCIVGEAKDGHGNLDDALFDFITQFKPSNGWDQTEIKVYGDRSGHAKTHRSKHTDFQYIRNELGQFYKRIEIEASRLVAPEAASVETVNRLFNANQIICLSSCPGLIRSWQATRWRTAERKLHKPAGETWTHRSDGFKYLTYQLEVIEAIHSEKRIMGINRT